MTDPDSRKDDDDLSPEEERAEEIADLQQELVWLTERRAILMNGPHPKGRASRALDRLFKWPRVPFSWAALIAAAIAAYILISPHPVVPVAAATALYAAMFACAYVWEIVAAHRHWRENRSQIIAELDAEIGEVRNDLFRLGVRDTAAASLGGQARGPV